MHDLHSGFTNAIENQIFADGEAAIAGAYLITRTSGMGSIAQNPKMMREPVYEAVSSGFAVSGDVIPDVERIAARPPSEAETHQTGG